MSPRKFEVVKMLDKEAVRPYLVRKVMNVGNSKAVTLPPWWAKEGEEVFLEVHPDRIVVFKGYAVLPIRLGEKNKD